MPISEQKKFDIRRYLDSQQLCQSMRIAMCGMPGVGKYSFLERFSYPRLKIPPNIASLPRASAPPRPPRGRRNPYITNTPLYGRSQLSVWWPMCDWTSDGVLSATTTGKSDLLNVVSGQQSIFPAPAERSPLADGYVLCYDVGDRESFEALREVRREIRGCLEKKGWVSTGMDGKGEEEEEDGRAESGEKGGKGEGKEGESGITTDPVKEGNGKAMDDEEVGDKEEKEKEEVDMLVLTPAQRKKRADRITAAHWKRKVENDRRAKKPMMLVACKSDRPLEAWEVSEAEGQAFAREINAVFVISSAISGVGVSEAIEEIQGRVILAWLEVEGARLAEPIAKLRKSEFR